MAMVASASRVASASNWLATSAYAYSAFVASTRLVTTAVRWVAALVGASVAYLLVMLALAAFWRHDSAHAAICCAGGMAVAVLCGAWAASVVLLPGHRAAGVWVCTILGMLYPLALAAGSDPGAPVRAMQFMYAVTAAVGGVVALWTLPPMRSATISYTAHA
jgi:hypothetical protein